MDRRDFLSGAIAATAAAAIPSAVKSAPTQYETARELLNKALASPAKGLLLVRPLKDTLDDVCFVNELTPATIQHCEIEYPSQVYIVASDALLDDLRKGAFPSGLFDTATVICGPLGKPFLCLRNAHVNAGNLGWIIGYDLA